MKKILVFSGSNSSKSVNQKVAIYAASLTELETTVIDLRDYDLPMYGVDMER